MNKYLCLSGLVALFVITGCSTTKTVSNIDHVVSKEAMYLRGVFNWWEARETFRLLDANNKVFTTTVNLIADGQPYDFKIADKNWTPELSCGALPGKGEITLNSEQVVFCNANSDNFKFTPQETGIFRFKMDFSHLTPRLTINRE